MDSKQLFEALASIEHERWADWQRWVHNRCTELPDGSLVIAADDVRHWDRQINTPYEELNEKEKESDREQVRRYYGLIEKYLTQS